MKNTFYYLALFLTFSCKSTLSEKKSIKITTNLVDTISLPIGDKSISSFSIDDSLFQNLRKQKDSILFLDKNLILDSIKIKRNFTPNEEIIMVGIDENPNSYLIENNCVIYSDEICLKILHTKFFNKTYLMSTQNDSIVDIKLIHYFHQGEMGFTKGRNFHLNKDGILTLLEYRLTEDKPYFSISKYLLNKNHYFIPFYEVNGYFNNDEEQGLVQNHTKEGIWIEKKENGYHGFNFTYLESEFQQGIPVGTWRYYELMEDYDKNGSPIPKTQKKGDLLYTETYKNGDLKERKFVKE